MKNIKAKLAGVVRSRGLASTSITALFIGILIAVNVIVYALTTAFGLYIVPSGETYDFSLKGNTDELFAEAMAEGEQVTVMFCRPEDEMPISITNSTDAVGIFYLTAKEFVNKYPNLINFEFVNILTRRNSSGEIVDLAKYKVSEDDGTEYGISEYTVIFICGDRYRTVVDISASAFAFDQSTGYSTSYFGQEVFSSLVCWVLREDHKKAYFTTYHSETIDPAFSNILACSGYEIDTVNLRKSAVPDDADLVIISNPQSDFERAAEGSNVRSEIERLRTYVEEGGNLYISLDPYVSKLPVLESFIAEYGISYSETERDGTLYRNMIKDKDNSISIDNLTVVAQLSETQLGADIKANIEKYNSSGIIVRDCAAINVSGTAKPLLLASSSSEIYAGSEQIDDGGNYCIGALSSTQASDSKSGNIFVVPTITLSAGDAIQSSGYANRELLYSILDYVYGAQDVPYGCSVYYLDTGILQNLTKKMMRVYTVIIAAVPVSAAIVGAVIVKRRKNR